MTMKWQKPQRYVEEQIQKPIQTIGAVAVIALAIAVAALLIAIGNGGNNAA